MKQSKPTLLETKKIETLISIQRAKEKKQGIDQFLLIGIVVFCMVILYVVFSANNSTNDNTFNSRQQIDNPARDFNKGKVQPKSINR